MFSIIEFLNLTQKIFKNKFFKILLNSFFGFIVIIVSYTFFIFSNNNVSKILLISLLIACIASDIGGYVIGKLFKGPKLTTISPNKPFSGAIGSLVFQLHLFHYIIIIILRALENNDVGITNQHVKQNLFLC